jgi:DNA-binding transcriptional ArsR family regulator
LPVRHPPALTNPQLAKAASHPTRIRLLTALHERIASPSELAKEFGEETKHIAYHVKVLLALGCIELVEVEQAAGGRAAKHYYRAIVRPYFNAEDWELMGDNEKQSLLTTLMSLVSEDIADAMKTGTFYDPDDNHLSRTPMVVDGEGWREVISLLDCTVDKLFAIQERVISRNKDGNAKTMPAKVEILHFRSPDSREPAIPER